METVVLIGGFLYIGILGWFVMDRIGRFIDEGGFWDGDEERNAEQERQDSCNSSSPKV